jgi:hypothetical protein
MPAPGRPQKISFAEMREQGVRGLLIYCADYTCSHSTAISGDRWPDDVRLSDIEERFTCSVCGKRGADVRPDFNWKEKPVAMMRLSVTATAQSSGQSETLSASLRCLSTGRCRLHVDWSPGKDWHGPL